MHQWRVLTKENFYPRSPRGERPSGSAQRRSRLNFYPRSPRGERPASPRHGHKTDQHFYPRSPRGERPSALLITVSLPKHFYPRSPRGERPASLCHCYFFAGFLSTLPARGATARMEFVLSCINISIHAPREGSDGLSATPNHVLSDFYPRSPRGERLNKYAKTKTCSKISIHAPREGSDQIGVNIVFAIIISIHAPREGSDGLSAHPTHAAAHFYPRSPRGERQEASMQDNTNDKISIHAPREGSDWVISTGRQKVADFYPRSPRGERQEARSDG